MIDNIGRDIDYIRISITDRCNMRCVYCMPEEGVESMRHEEILTFDEIIRIVKRLQKLGFRKVKVTGGEPLVRKGCVSLIRQIKEIPGIENITLTTNAVLLEENMAALYEAGIDGINISLDTLDRKEYESITNRDYLDRTLAGIKAAMKYPDINLKINCVPITEDTSRLIELARIAKENKIHVRFIEMMPIGLGKRFSCVREAAILEILEKEFGKAVPYEKKMGNGPGHYYAFEDFKGKIGFISAVSHKFCDKCNRVRLTSDGYLKACLQFQDGMSLRDLIRGGCTDEELDEAIKSVLLHKPVGHHFEEVQMDEDELRLMAQIGG